MATFTPAPRSLSLRELDSLECALRSGLAPELDMARRLMVTVRELQADLRRRASRSQDDMQDPTAIGRAR
jgi:hypothetical protein